MTQNGGATLNSRHVFYHLRDKHKLKLKQQAGTKGRFYYSKSNVSANLFWDQSTEQPLFPMWFQNGFKMYWLRAIWIFFNEDFVKSEFNRCHWSFWQSNWWAKEQAPESWTIVKQFSWSCVQNDNARKLVLGQIIWFCLQQWVHIHDLWWWSCCTCVPGPQSLTHNFLHKLW